MKKYLSILAALLIAMSASAGSLPKLTLTLSGTVGEDWIDGCKVNFNSTDYSDVSVEYSGSAAKKNYRIKLNKKKALIGENKYKQWVLLSNNDDATKMRNALADEISKLTGMEYTPQYQFVDLYINGTYAGVYQLTDRVKCEVGRACAGDATDIEWLVQMSEQKDVSASDTYVTGTDAMPYIVMKNPDPDDFVNDQATLESHRKAMETYFTSFFANPKNELKQDQFVAWYIASEIICNYKGFSDVFAYRSTYGSGQQLRFGPIWDNEKGFDNNSGHPLDMSDVNTSGSYEGLMLKYADYKLLRKWVKGIMENASDSWFRDAVWTKWQTVKSSEQTLINKVGELHNTIALSAVSGSTNTTAEEALKSYITTRFAYLDAKFAELSGHSSSGISAVSDDTHSSNAIYSITGQRLSAQPSHGVYIKNGKKVLVK